MKIYFTSETLWSWECVFVGVIIQLSQFSVSLSVSNEVVLTTVKEGTALKFQVNVPECIKLVEKGIDGKLFSVEHGGNCVEIHAKEDCTGDFVTVKPGVPATKELYRWNLNDKRDWIEIEGGAKAVSPCTPKCHENNVEHFEPDRITKVVLYSDTNFTGTRENMTVERCTVIPKVLRSKVNSLKTDGSVCIELYERRDCSGESIQIPRQTPLHLTRDLEDWGFSSKAIAISLCGYNCPNSNLREEDSLTNVSSETIEIVFYSEPHFNGESRVLQIGPEICTQVTDEWVNTEEIRSIQNHEYCIYIFQEEDCKKSGNFIRLNSFKESRDLNLQEWKSGIKSISHCRLIELDYVTLVRFYIFAKLMDPITLLIIVFFIFLLAKIVTFQKNWIFTATQQNSEITHRNKNSNKKPKQKRP